MCLANRKPAALDDAPSGTVEVLERVDVAAAVGCMPGHQPRPAPAWITANIGATLLDIMVTLLLRRINAARLAIAVTTVHASCGSHDTHDVLVRQIP